jgi:hypothetical protein
MIMKRGGHEGMEWGARGHLKGDENETRDVVSDGLFFFFSAAAYFYISGHQYR